ncbi:uncharacterized protein LOC131950918 [Physella acuta]|uniref:uncharacterized protein LOC131950918 n=1 Tax=Physella acuta TaxID=109671 RepID=UPI0027DBB0FA|nr:uncharacterized protein LOC131950918 [Physella acuta]
MRFNILDDSAEENQNIFDDPSNTDPISNDTVTTSIALGHPTKSSRQTPDITSSVHQNSFLEDSSLWGSLPNIALSSTSITRIPSASDDVTKPKKRRPLRLPPILLPRIYTIAPRPLKYREFMTPTKARGSISDAEWEDLKDCRYIRNGLPRFSLPLTPSRMSSFHF